MAAAPDAADGAAASADGGSGTLFGMLSTLVGTGTPTAPDASPAPDAPSGTPSAAAPRGARSETYWRQLLTRLRHEDAGPVRVFLQSRLRQFSMQDLNAAPATGAGSVQDQVQRLQRDALERMQKCDPWGDLDEAGWVHTAEAVERFVASQLHDVALGRLAADRAADDAFTARCDALSTFVRPEHLHVPVAATAPRFADAWASAQDFLHRMAAYKDPWRKLMCIDRCCRQLYRVLHAAAAQERADRAAVRAGAPAPAEGEAGDDASAPAPPPAPAPAESASGPSADDLVPCVIWCLLRSNPPRLRSHMAFIERFRPSARLRGSLAYHFTVLQSSVHFLESCTAAGLSMEPEAFAASLAEGEAAAASRSRLARQLQSLGDGDIADDGTGSGGPPEPTTSTPAPAGLPPPGLALLAPAPAAHMLPLRPPLPEPTQEALAAWRARRYRFIGRDPASLTMAEVPQLLEEYRNLAATCRSVAEALGLPPPDVAALAPEEEDGDTAAAGDEAKG